MDWFQQYNLCCRISLFNPEQVLVETYDSHYLDYEDALSITHKPAFTYNKQTEQIQELDDHDPTETTKDSIYIDNIVHQIETLHATANDDVSIAIVKYFQACISDLEKVYFLIVVPNSWGNELIHSTLVPLFKKAGIVSHSVFITQVDAAISNFQTNVYFKERIPPCFRKEESCAVFDIQMDKEEISLRSTVCQIQKDPGLKLFDEPFYTAEVEHVDNSEKFNKKSVDGIRDALVQAVFKNIFDLEDLISDTDVPEGGEGCNNVAEYILDDMLMNIRDAVTQGYTFDSNMRIFYDSAVIKKHLDESQQKHLFTKEFFDALIKEITALISIESAVDFIVSQIENNAQDTAVIINGCHDYETSDFRSTLYPVFFYLIQKEVQARFGLTKWHFIKEGLRNVHVRQGSFAKMARKSMIDNMSLEPVIIEKHTELNKLGLPYYYAVDKPVESSNVPKTIVHIDVSVNSTQVICETMDAEGRVQKSFSIAVDEKLSNDSLEELKVADASNNKVKDIFITDLKRIVASVNDQLEKTVDLERVGYVLSVEKSIMNNLQLGSRDELLALVKSTEPLIVVNQGEKIIWKMLQENPLNSSSFYVHAHMSDKHIYLVLKQVVGSSAISLQDKLITIKDVHEQVSEKLWTHINSLDEAEKKMYVSSGEAIDHANDYKTFHSKFAETFKNEFSLKDAYDTDLVLEIDNISIPVQHIMDIAVIPVLKQLAVDIFSCLVEKDVFGYYNLADLFITGGFLKVKEDSDAYNYTITHAIKKELTRLIKERHLNTKIRLDLTTSTQHAPVSESGSEQKAFGYDVFLKGELRPVSSTTYFMSEDSTDKEYNADWTLGGSLKHDRSSALILCGAEFSNKKFEMTSVKRTQDGDSFYIGIQRFTEPRTLKDIENAGDFVDVLQPEHLHFCNLEFTSVKTVSVEPLYYKSCVKITIDNYYPEKQEHDVFTFIFGERQTLKYFK